MNVSGYFLEHIAWDPVARIEVSRIPPPDPEHIPYPVLIGDNPAFLKRFKRIALRCEKTARNYGSFVALACSFILIKSVHTT